MLTSASSSSLTLIPVSYEFVSNSAWTVRPVCVVVLAMRLTMVSWLTREVVHADLFGITLRPPFLSAVLEIPDQLLLLGGHGDGRLLSLQKALYLFVDVFELRIAVGV